MTYLDKLNAEFEAAAKAAKAGAQQLIPEQEEPDETTQDG